MLSKLSTLTAAGVLCVASLFLAGCSSSNVIALLDATVASADAATSVLAADGAIPVATEQKIVNYLGQVTTASSEAAVELKSSDTAAQKDIKVAADFAAIAAPDLSKASPAIRASIQAVLAAVKAFLAAIQTTGAAIARALPKANYGPLDRARLDSIARHAARVAHRLAKL